MYYQRLSIHNQCVSIVYGITLCINNVELVYVKFFYINNEFVCMTLYKLRIGMCDPLFLC